MIKAKYRVDITEYERGWGQRPDGHILFDSKKEAEDYIKEHNAQNNKARVPDIYWVAGRPYLVEV